MKHTLKYLLDTDICIYLLHGDERVRDRVAQVGIESISVSILTIGELYFGAFNSARVKANLQRVRELLSEPGPAIISVDKKAVECFGRFKADLRRKGQIIGDFDLLIAGIAVGNELKLVTNNIGHFNRIPEVLLENWFTGDDQYQQL